MQKSLVPSISIHNGISMTQCSIPTVRRLISSLSCHTREDLRLHHSGFTTILLKSSFIGLIPCPHRREVNIAYIYCGPLYRISWQCCLEQTQFCVRCTTEFRFQKTDSNLKTVSPLFLFSFYSSKQKMKFFNC